MGRRGEKGKRAQGRKEVVRPLAYLLLCLPAVWSLWGCGCEPWGGGLPEATLAQVGQEQITVDDFEREFKELILEPGKEPAGANLLALKEAYLDQVIERKILAQEARRSGITVAPEELNQALLDVKMDYPGEGFGEKLGLNGVTPEEWKTRLEEKLLAEKMIRSSRGYAGEIDERDVRRYYEDHRSEFKVKPRVRARQIVVADGEEAIQILKRLRKGESFEKVAMEKSLGPERVNGGDLGFFSQGERPAEFDHVFTMDVGATSEVIKSPYGYHIFKLEKKLEGREVPYDEAKPRILQLLAQKKGEEAYEKWLAGLKSRARVKINRKRLLS